MSGKRKDIMDGVGPSGFDRKGPQDLTRNPSSRGVHNDSGCVGPPSVLGAPE